jgi:hypothetical protein
MTDFGSWIQENWYQLGSFFVQCGFFFLAVWFAGKILRTLRSSQEQLGALLKLSVAGQQTERLSESPARARLEASRYWLQPDSPASSAPGFAPELRVSRNVTEHPGFFEWWKAPMGITTGTSSFHRVLRWFQSPAGA